MAKKTAAFFVGSLALLLAASACSDEDDDGSEVESGATGGSTSVNLEGIGATLSGTIEGEPGSCTIVPSDDGCTGTSYEGENIPLDIYIMFDQSGSMGSCDDPPTDKKPCQDEANTNSRINAIRSATETFLRDDNSAGISVGIGYFGHQTIGTTSCMPADYSNAAVPFGELPEHADAIMSSLDAVEPTGETPTGPAIEGACSYARNHKEENPSHKVVMLFITDGEPKAPVTCPNGTGACCPTLEGAVEAATACRNGDPGIQTYVLGVGPFLDNLEDIADAGGTDRAYLVQEGNAGEQVLDALNRIRGDAQIPCELSIPPPPSGEEINYDQVNIIHADPDCNGTVFGYVEEVSGCTSDGGWYYDDRDAPSKINLCPTSCDQVTVPGSDLLLSVGCQTYVPIH